MKPDVYEGTEPYIFVSYAHKDAENVFKVLGELQERGCRFWYDDGIAPGSEWPEDIAQHLAAASMVLAIITPASMQSTNCRREINFSLAREIPFLSIMLEPTQLPLGMEMQLSAQQMIVRQNFEEWDKFIDKIMSCRDILPCSSTQQPGTQTATGSRVAPPQGATPAQPEAQSYTNAQVPCHPTQPKTVLPGADNAIPAVGAPGEQAAALSPQPTPAAAPQPITPMQAGWQGEATAAVTAVGPSARTIRQANAASAPQEKKRKTPIAAIAIAIIAALAIVAFAVGYFATPRTFTTSWGDEVKLNASSVHFSDKKLTQDDLDNIAALEQLSHLDLTSCDLASCDFSGTTFVSQDIYSVNLSDSTGIVDYSFLGSLPLGSVRLSNCSAFDDLSMLDTSKLSTLYVDGTAVQDLQPLSTAASLDELSIANTAVDDLGPLAGLSSLHQLYASNSAITSIDPLLDLEGLWNIDLSGCTLATPERPFSSLSLERVDLSNTGVSNLDFLSDCTVLEELDVSGNSDLADLDSLDPQNSETLTSLDLAGTGLDGSDLEWASACTSLESLSIDNLPVDNLGFCSQMANLTHISAVGCGITDIEGLAGCPNLKTMQLGANQIESVSALASLAETDTFDTIIDLSYNNLESIEALPAGEYRALLLCGNDQSIASTLPDGVSGFEIVVPWHEGIEQSTLADRESFSKIYLVDCPQNQKLNATEAFGESRTAFISEADFVAMLREDSFDYRLDLDNSALVAAIAG